MGELFKFQDCRMYASAAVPCIGCGKTRKRIAVEHYTVTEPTRAEEVMNAQVRLDAQVARLVAQGRTCRKCERDCV